MDEQVDIPQQEDQQQPQGQDTPTLPPEKRKELHGIITKMVLNRESEDNIKLVIDHYTKKNVQAPVQSVAPEAPKSRFSIQDKPYNFLQYPSIEEAQQQLHERHQKELSDADQTVNKHLEQSQAEAAQLLKRNESKADQSSYANTNAYLSGNFVPEPDRNFNVEPTPEQVHATISNPDNHAALIDLKAQNLESAGKKKDANKLRADAYLLTSANRGGNTAKQLENAQKIKNGEVEYSPVKDELVKPLSFGEGVHEAWKKRDEDMQLFDLADNGTDQQLIQKLNSLQQKDPDEPIPTPGTVGEFVGSQGKVTGEMVAANILLNEIPVIGTKAAEAVSGGLYAHEFGRRGYVNELQKSYLANKQAGLSDEESLDRAKSQAKTAMVTDAATAALMGVGTGKAGGKLFRNTAENAVKIASEGGWYNGVIKSAYKHIGEEAPAAIKNASLAAGGEIAKNISANQHGENRDVLEGSGGAALNMAALHYVTSSALAVLGKVMNSDKSGSKKITNELLQGASKLPIEDIKNISIEQIRDGIVTPQEAQSNIEAIEAHKEIDAQIPKSVVNDKIRLELQDIVRKREATAEEKSKVSAAFAEPFKLKIEGYDEKINELANSPEAKQETPAPEPEKPRVTVSTPNIVNVKLKEPISEPINEPIKEELVTSAEEAPVVGEEKTIGIKNAKSEEIRGQFNLPKVELPKMGSDAEVVGEGKRLVDSGEVNPREVVARVLDKKEGIQPAEAKALQYYMHQLDAHESNLREQLHSAETPEGKAEVHGKLQQLSDEVDRATSANMISGTAWSDVGNIRQIVTDKGFNPSRERTFIKDAYGGEIPENVKVKLDAITKERDEALVAKAKVEEELRQKMAVKGFEEVKKQAKRTAKNAETKELLKKEEQDLLDALKKAFKKDIGNANAGIPIPVETLEVLGKLAVNYVKQGVNGLEALVDKLHANIGEDSGLSKKEIRNIIAEYESLQEVQETNRLNKKADLLQDKITPTILKTKKGEVAGHSEPTDFNKSTKVQKSFRKSTEWTKAQQRVANAEHRIKVEKRKAFESQKNMYQKGLAWLGRGVRLSVLSGYNVLAKLTAAATIGSAGKRIPEQAIGAIYQNIFKGIAEKAPIEGGINASAEAKFYKEFFNPKKFAHNAWEILKTGSSDLGKRLGSAEYEHIPGLYLPTDLHQIIKDPPKRAVFEASSKNGMNWAEKNGLDITDPLVINSIENASYKRAQYEIFQEQNWLSKKFTSWKSKLEKSGNTGATAKFLVDFLIPVSTVPTNIARRVITTSPLGLIRGGKEVVEAYRNGISKLTSEQADHVMMQLKQGTLGTALWLVGWYGAKSFGGLYSKFNPDKKRNEGELTSDAMMIDGKMVPKPVQHALPLEIIQFAATARHIYDHSVKGEGTPAALYHAGLGSIGGLVEQIPVIETGAHLVGATTNKYEADKLKDDAVRRFEPQILRETGIIKKDAPKKKASTNSRNTSRK